MKKINLLKRRREELNLLGNFQIIPTNTLLLKGTFFASIIISSLFILLFGIILYNQQLKLQKNKLQPYTDKYNLIQKELINKNRLINKLNNTNKNLIDAISGIRSGSGLFIEIGKITPKLIELNKIEVGKTGVKFIGITPQKNGLKVMNSYQLSLASSPFFNDKSVKIIKASKFSRNDYSRIEKKSIKKNYLNFEIIATFNEVSKFVSSKYLFDLGSYGLANRLNLIDKIKKQ